MKSRLASGMSPGLSQQFREGSCKLQHFSVPPHSQWQMLLSKMYGMETLEFDQGPKSAQNPRPKQASGGAGEKWHFVFVRVSLPS